MSIPGKVLIALLCAAVASALGATFSPEFPLLVFLGPCALASVLAVVLSHRALPAPPAIRADAPQTPAQQQPAGSNGPKNKPRQRSESGRSKGSRADSKVAAPEPSPAPEPAARKKESASGPKESGTVKWFNGTKGFGFIIRESGEEIFVHHRSIEGDGRRSLRDGAPVRFRVVETDKGPQAEDVESEP